jgi:hypothetical protein
LVIGLLAAALRIHGRWSVDYGGRETRANRNAFEYRPRLQRSTSSVLENRYSSVNVVTG